MHTQLGNPSFDSVCVWQMLCRYCGMCLLRRGKHGKFGLSIHTKIFTIGWIAKKFDTDIHDPLTFSFTVTMRLAFVSDFSDPLKVEG